MWIGSWYLRASGIQIFFWRHITAANQHFTMIFDEFQIRLLKPNMKIKPAEISAAENAQNN